MKKGRVERLALSAMFMALGLALPFLTGQIPQIGGMLLPMHLPVLICGFVCGWKWGLAVGLVTPLLRSLLFGMPPMMPTAICMAFELATYGAVAGYLYGRLEGSKLRVLASLVTAMLVGRVVWGIASFAVYSLFTQRAFTLAMFWAGGFAGAWPGMLLQLVLVPLIVYALEKAKLVPIGRAKIA